MNNVIIGAVRALCENAPYYMQNSDQAIPDILYPPFPHCKTGPQWLRLCVGSSSPSVPVLSMRPCYVEKINFHRTVAYCVATMTSLPLIVHVLFATDGTLQPDDILPLLWLLICWGIVLAIAVLFYFLLPHKRVYTPVRTGEGVYQGDFTLCDQTRHGFGAMMGDSGEKYLGGFMYGCRSGKGLMWTDYDESYYEGKWKQSKRHGFGRANLLKTAGDFSQDRGRDFQTTLAFQKQRTIESMLRYVRSEDHRRELMKVLEGLRATHAHFSPKAGAADAAAGGSQQALLAPGPCEPEPEAEAPAPGAVPEEQEEAGKGPPAAGAGQQLEVPRPATAGVQMSAAELEGAQGLGADMKYYYLYEGLWADDLPHGLGIKRFEDGEVFKGHFVAGKESGKGLWTLFNGEQIEGTWVDGILHRADVADHVADAPAGSHGAAAAGEDGEPEGARPERGQCSYVGGWRYGLEHGEGKRLYPYGNLYDGSWIAGQRHGAGSMRFAGVGDYIGEWRRGLRCGEGTMTYADGGYYSGHWADDMHNGWGKRVEPGGEKYEGAFLDGKRHGWGVAERMDGSTYQGAWVDGLEHGEGNWVGPLGEQYEGTWRGGCKHGAGTYTLVSNVAYRGTFETDCAQGEGTLTVPDLGEYKGAFHRGMKSGKGVFLFANGCRFEGMWQVAFLPSPTQFVPPPARPPGAGDSPVSGTADPRSSQTGQVIRGLR